MYLSELLAALARRWWLVMLGVLATVGLCFGAYTFVPIEHEIHATMLVLPPETTTQLVHNPLLALGDLPPAADVLARAMSSGDVADALVPPGSTGEYTVARDTSTNGPLLAITAIDRTAEQAGALLDAVVARMPEEFASVQARIRVSDSATMKLMLLSRETRTTESNTNQVRAVLVAAVGGLALTVFGASLVDGLLRRRKTARRPTRRDDSADGESPPPAGPARESSQLPVPITEARSDMIEAPAAVVVQPRILAMTPPRRGDDEHLEETLPT